MFHLTDLWVLKVGLGLGFLSSSALLPALQQGVPGSAKDWLIQNQLLTPDQWDQCLHKAQSLPAWPESRENYHRDNQFIFRYLQESQAISLPLLEENLVACQKLYNPHRALRLDELLVKKELIQSNTPESFLKIKTLAPFHCPSCRYQITLKRFYPWWQIICPLGAHPLVPSHGPAHQNHPETLGPKQIPLEATHVSARDQKPPLSQLGRYRVLELLGEGGMGSVYLAYDPEMEREVALKVIVPSSQKDSQYLKRFQEEVRLAAGLNHPGIIPLYDFGETDGFYFFTMACIRGRDLRSVIEEDGPLSERKAIKMMAEIVEAVAYAHEKGVIHRDIKPENIMISNLGQPILMDFGLARQVGKGGTRLTQAGSIIGSPEFMAPEQALGEDTSFGADIYALGGTLFFMLTGRPPFQSKEILPLLKKVVEEPAPSLGSLQIRVGKGVEKMMGKCLKKNVKKRYQTAEDLLIDLEKIEKGDSISTDYSGRFIQDKKRNKQYLLTVLLGVCFVIMGALVVLWMGQKQKKSTRVLIKKNPPSQTIQSRIGPLLKRYNRGDWEGVFEKFKSLSPKDPQYLKARLYHGFALAYFFRLKQAKKEVTFLEKSRVSSDKLKILKAYLFLEENKGARALVIYQKLIQKGIRSADLFLGMGLYYIWKKYDFQQGGKFIDRALALSPQRVDILYRHLNVLSSATRYRQLWHEVTKALAQNPSDFKLHYYGYRALGKLERPEKAQKALERSFDLLQKKRKKYPRNLKIYQFFLVLLFYTRQYQRLIDLCETGLAEPEKRAFCYQGLGLVYLKRRRYDKAKDVFERCIRESRNRLSQGRIFVSVVRTSQYKLGCLYFYRGHLSQAEKVFQDLRRGRPNYTSAFFWLARIYWKKGKRDKATDLLEMALKSNPTSGDIFKFLTSLYLAQKNYRRFVQLAQGASKRFDQLPHGYFIELQGMIYAAQLFGETWSREKYRHHFNKLYQLANQALKLYPKRGFFHFVRGTCLYQSGKYARAQKAFFRAKQYGTKRSKYWREVLLYLRKLRALVQPR